MDHETVLLMCEESIAEEIRQVLNELCRQSCFLEFQRTHASIGEVKRMDSPAFPGTANLFLFPTGEEQITIIREKVQHLRTSCPYKCCLKMMAMDVQEVL